MSDQLHAEISQALHQELHSAIYDLAKSVEIAVTQMNLRAECDAAIAAAKKAEFAAETLRNACEIEDGDRAAISLVPEMQSRKTNSLALSSKESGSDFSQSERSALSATTVVREESKIATRIAELQERLKKQNNVLII